MGGGNVNRRMLPVLQGIHLNARRIDVHRQHRMAHAGKDLVCLAINRVFQGDGKGIA